LVFKTITVVSARKGPKDVWDAKFFKTLAATGKIYPPRHFSRTQLVIMHIHHPFESFQRICLPFVLLIWQRRCVCG
jgi:hypothetical protein